AGEGEPGEREARLRARQSDLVRARGRAESVQAEVTKAKVSAAALAERREGLARSVQRMQEQRSEVESRREKLQAEIAQGKERDAALQAKAEMCQQELRRLLAESERLREELGRARAHYDQAQERLRGGDEEVRQAREEARTIGERRGKAELALQGTRLELTHLEQQVRERHLMELADVSAARREAALQLEISEAEEQMHSLREKIDALGEVSLTAIDEAREVGERFAFLSSQKTDLEESIAKLRSAIGRIDRASKERFRETFQLVNDRFQQVFPKLFRGGTAELQLVEDPANPSAEPGVEIGAQPQRRRSRGRSFRLPALISAGRAVLFRHAPLDHPGSHRAVPRLLRAGGRYQAAPDLRGARGRERRPGPSRGAHHRRDRSAVRDLPPPLARRQGGGLADGEERLRRRLPGELPGRPGHRVLDRSERSA